MAVKQAHINHITYAEMLVLLNNDCVPISKIMEHTGLGWRPVASYIKALKDRRLIRIGQYKMIHSVLVKCYEWNSDNQHDVKPPVMRTAAQRQRDYRQRKKASALINIISKKEREEDEPQRDG